MFYREGAKIAKGRLSGESIFLGESFGQTRRGQNLFRQIGDEPGESIAFL